MVKRRSRKAKPRKAARKPARRKTVRRTSSRKTIDSPAQAVAKNRKAQWAVYRDLQKKTDKAWAKLRANVKRKAGTDVLLRDRKDLLLLLGECNYLAGECMRMERKR